MPIRRLDVDGAPIKHPRHGAAWLIKAVPRLAASVFLMHAAGQALGSEALRFVYELHVAQGTHVIVVFDDGATYHSLVPNDSSAPAACSNHRRISLSLLTSYDYAGLRRKGKLETKLDSAEVTRHWRAIAKSPVEYVAESDPTMHGGVSCTFAVVGKPIEQLSDLRLIQFGSLFFDVLPRSSEQREAARWLWRAIYDLARRVSAGSHQP